MNAFKDQIFVGGDGADTFTGGDRDDVLIGGAGDDTLFGGAGNDELYGGIGRDTLNGGVGYDIYHLNGADTIQDSDGVGTLVTKAGKRITGAIEKRADGTYVFLNDSTIAVTLGTDLTLTLSDGTSATIQGFHDGDLGIQLSGTAPKPVTNRTILGDLAHKDFNLSQPGIQIQRDDLDNIIVDPNQPAPDQIDALYDSAGNDDIKSFGGDDYIDAWRGGDDHLDGGSGDDVVMGRDGNDIIVGGTGSDRLRGDRGSDMLYAGQEVTLEAALAAQDNTPSGLKGDWLDGSEDDDVLVGDVGNDGLAGGTGDDVIVGGAGDDNILGDLKTSNVEANWSVTRSVTTQGNSTQYGLQFSGIFYDSPTSGGNDTIFAGGGADWVFGDDGDDYVDGGAGADVLFGGRGKDELFGGSGNDVIVGDDSSIPLAEHGDDYLDGQDGDDQLYGGGGNDELYGGAGKDALYGNEGDDVLYGEDGDDVLVGGAGRDRLSGGAGADFLQGDSAIGTTNSDDYLDGGDGDDTLLGVGGSDEIYGGAGADQIAGDNGGADTSGEADRLYGEAGNDTIDGQGGDDYIDGGADNDLLLGGLGNDTLLGGTGDDQLQGGAGDDSLDGGDGVDVLFGEAGADSIQGGAGNDYLIGGLGDDVLAGGDGDDVYYYSTGDGNDRISDSSGTDWLVFNDLYATQIVLGVGSLKLTLPDGSTIDLADFDPEHPFAAGGIEYFQFADNSVMTRAQLISTLGITPVGTPGPDVMSGTALSETIRSLAGDDVVMALEGNDTVYAGDGADVVYGGDGNDTIYGGAGDDVLAGEAGDDTIYGEAGNDLLSGGAGVDSLNGGDGDDTYLFQIGDGQDTVVDPLGQNTIALGAGLSLDTIRVGRQGNDLLIAVKAAADKLTVKDWFAADSHFKGIILVDGTVLGRPAVEAAIPSNLPPVANPDAVAVTEDSMLSASGNALANDSDPEGRSLRITNPGTYTGTFGSVSLQAAGAFTYTLANASSAVQSLAAGQSATDRFSYSVTDDDPAAPASTQADIVVTVNGSNDLPVLGSDTVLTAEDAIPVQGNVLANDSDIDAGTVLTVADPGTRVGTYGSLALNSDGSWRYTLANSSVVVQSLAAGQTVGENFAFKVSDGVAQVTGALAVSIAGANDAPALLIPLPDQSSGTNTSWTWKVPTGSFGDVDAGDILTYRATLADGTALPSWLTFAASTQTFSGRVPKASVGSIAIRVSAVDRLGAQATDDFSLSFVSGGGGGGGGNGGVGSLANEGVGNGVDAPPPGHSISFNDGPGTGPGNPGAKGGNGYRPPARANLPFSSKHVQTMRGEAVVTHAASVASPQNNSQSPSPNSSRDVAPGQVRKTPATGSAGPLQIDAGGAASEGVPKFLTKAMWSDVEQQPPSRAPSLPTGTNPWGEESASVVAAWQAVQAAIASDTNPGARMLGSDRPLAGILPSLQTGNTASARGSGPDTIGLQAGAMLQKFQGFGQGLQEIA